MASMLPVHQPMNSARTVFRGGTIALALLAVVPGYYAVTLRWVPSADFDVTGILFVLQNLPRLTAMVCAVGFAGTAVYFWVRSLRSD